MASAADFRRWVEISVDSAPRDLIDAAILRAVDEFLKYTGLWSAESAGIQLVDGTAAYAVTAPTGGTVCRVEAVRYKTTLLAPADPSMGATYLGGDAPYAFWFGTDGYIHLSPTPAGTFGVTDLLKFRAISTILSGAGTAPTIPDFVAADYHDAIVAGAVARLLEIPGKGWTDRVAAREFKRAFTAGCGDGRVAAATGNTVNILPPSFPQTA